MSQCDSDAVFACQPSSGIVEKWDDHKMKLDRDLDCSSGYFTHMRVRGKVNLSPDQLFRIMDEPDYCRIFSANKAGFQ